MKKKFTLFLFFIMTIMSFSCKKASLRGDDIGGSASGTGEITPSLICSGGSNTISSNFNGTSIKKGNSIWINAHFGINGNVDLSTVITMSNIQINFSDGSTPYSLQAPNATITFNNGSTQTATYDGSSWAINVPISQKGNIFFTGLIFESPGLKGGINPVNFTADFGATTTGITFDWQWSAAVFDTKMDYNNLNVVVADKSGAHAGEPSGYKGHAIGGARGGGSANLTGSWSATGHVTPCILLKSIKQGD